MLGGALIWGAAMVPVQGASAAPPGARTALQRAGQTSPEVVSPGPDELPNPQEDKRRALRQEALSQVLEGTARPQKRAGSTVVKLEGANAANQGDAGQDRYVELA